MNFTAPFTIDRWIEFIHNLQDKMCSALEVIDTQAKFQEDIWHREQGGGGKTRIMANGSFLEKGGVNTSHVYGKVTDAMKNLIGDRGATWAAVGLSTVLHPFNPMIPTFHANWRYFELYDPDGQVVDAWFGGGMDLTPYYLFDEDAKLFHQVLKDALDPFGNQLYPLFKKQCDEYFNNHHRGIECRGIGGVFYDHLRAEDSYGLSLDQLFQFQQANSNCFFNNYLPIVARRMNLPFTPDQKYWQEIRRGRYVEFNLIHDRGTIFGLKTNGRTESILMSLPPTVRFDYNYQPQPDSEEARLLEVLRHPTDWV